MVFLDHPMQGQGKNLFLPNQTLSLLFTGFPVRSNPKEQRKYGRNHQKNKVMILMILMILIISQRGKREARRKEKVIVFIVFIVSLRIRRDQGSRASPVRLSPDPLTRGFKVQGSRPCPLASGFKVQGSRLGNFIIHHSLFLVLRSISI
jgi:hypothetical protein